MANKIEGTISSNKGFYIGDICYALSDSIYDDVWGGSGYEDGIHSVPESGYSFAVAGTAYGDGEYEDHQGRRYGVDAGNIGLVPEELAEDTDGGHYFEGGGEATFTAEDGVFEITLPSGEVVIIDTTEGGNFWEPDDLDY